MTLRQDGSHKESHKSSSSSKNRAAGQGVSATFSPTSGKVRLRSYPDRGDEDAEGEEEEEEVDEFGDMDD